MHPLTDYSSLQQQRAYLLGVLAAEESRAEQTARSLELVRNKMKVAEPATNEFGTARDLKKAVVKLARKLKRAERSVKAMVDNLAAVTSRMGNIERTQWRNANSEYRQRAQYHTINGLSIDLQRLGTVSPMTPGYSYSVQTAGSPYLPAFVQHVPVTPSMNPTPVVSSFEHMHGSPFHERTQVYKVTGQPWMEGMCYDSSWGPVYYAAPIRESLVYALPDEEAEVD